VRAPRHFIVLAAVAAALFSVSCRKSGERPADWDGPVLTFEETSHDFGPLYFGQTGTHVFRFRNDGGRNLVIDDVRKECGCTDPIFDTRRVPPGGEGTMTVSFRPPYPGKIDKKLWIYTNDAYARETVVRILSTGLGPAVLEPSVVEVDGVVPAEGIARDLVLDIPPNRRLVDVRFDVECPWMAVELLERTGPSSARFRFTLEPIPSRVLLREQIPVMITAEEGGRRLEFPLLFPLQVTGEVRPVAWAEPHAVHMGALARGSERSRRVGLEVPKDWGQIPADVRIEGLDGAAVARLEDPFAWELRMVVPEDAAGGRRLGRIVFDFGSGRAVTVPVHAWVRG